MILVLAPDCSEELLSSLVRDVERLGWRCESSRGDEQTIVTLSGRGDPAALEAALRGRSEIDVVPILSQREYRDLQTRRRMLAGLAGGLGALTAIAAGIPVLGFLMPPKGLVSDRNLVRVAGGGDLAESSARKVVVLGKPLLVVRLEHDRWFALSAICTHMDVCHLDWNAERRQLVCPCHGGAFDVYGNVVQGPPSIPLASFRIERIADDVFVRGEGA